MGGPALIDGIEHEVFDNFEGELTLFGITYQSPEHCFQANKFINLFTNPLEYYKEHVNYHHVCRILTDCAIGAYMLGNRREYKIRENWDDLRVDIMYQANLAKIKQNINLQNLLLDTTGIVTYPRSDRFWNKWNSINLMRIRDELLGDELDIELDELTKLFTK